MSEPHIHDCTGPTMTCPCGYKFSVPPISFGLDVSDGKTEVINEVFHCDSMDAVIDALEDAIGKLRNY